jgi:hypothetical protein
VKSEGCVELSAGAASPVQFADPKTRCGFFGGSVGAGAGAGFIVAGFAPGGVTRVAAAGVPAGRGAALACAVAADEDAVACGGAAEGVAVSEGVMGTGAGGASAEGLAAGGTGSSLGLVGAADREAPPIELAPRTAP